MPNKNSAPLATADEPLAKTSKRAPKPRRAALILPPCVLVGADVNAWSVIGRVKRAAWVVGFPSEDIPRWMVSFSKTYEETLSLALCLVTPVSLADAQKTRWKPFFGDESEKAYAKACVGAPIWNSSNETLAHYLDRGGDLNAKDAFGRSWLFTADKESAPGDHDKALASTLSALDRDSLGTPFFAHANAPELAAKAILAASKEELAVALAPDRAFGCDPIVWLLARGLIRDASARPPSKEMVASTLEALMESGVKSVQGELPSDLTSALVETMSNAKAGSANALARQGVALARLAGRVKGTGPINDQLRNALKKAQKANPSITALIEHDELDLSVNAAPAANSGSRRGRPRA